VRGKNWSFSRSWLHFTLQYVFTSENLRICITVALNFGDYVIFDFTRDGVFCVRKPNSCTILTTMSSYHWQPAMEYQLRGLPHAHILIFEDETVMVSSANFPFCF
jgi:hypothetical protein